MLSGLSLDDQLWHQSLVAYRHHQEVECVTGARALPDWAGVQQTDDDQVLLKLLERGITITWILSVIAIGCNDHQAL